jgi:hypothetical protein
MTNKQTRRIFLAMTAASTVSATALAAASPDDSELLKLKEEIFAARDAAKIYDDEVLRHFEAWQDEARRLEREAEAGRSNLTDIERWEVVIATPAAKEHDRLTKLQRPHHERQDALTERLLSIPARTAEGRKAKAAVFVECILPIHAIYDADDDEDEEELAYPLQVARQLLIEFTGGANAS